MDLRGDQQRTAAQDLYAGEDITNGDGSEREPDSNDIYLEKKTFSCDICDFVAHTKIRLKTHKLTKHSVEMVSCDQCGYLAKSRALLKKHKMVHRLDSVEDEKIEELPGKKEQLLLNF